ncbi:MAG: hypothetical protein ABI724_05585 [Betaproteobacteria bacterium]
MNRHETTMHRALFGIAAIAMSAVTLGVTVVLPASIHSDRHHAAQLAVANAAIRAPIEVAIIPARIDVVSECEQTMAMEPARQATPGADRSS